MVYPRSASVSLAAVLRFPLRQYTKMGAVLSAGSSAARVRMSVWGISVLLGMWPRGVLLGRAHVEKEGSWSVVEARLPLGGGQRLEARTRDASRERERGDACECEEEGPHDPFTHASRHKRAVVLQCCARAPDSGDPVTERIRRGRAECAIVMHKSTTDDPLDAELRRLRDQRLAQARRGPAAPTATTIKLTDQTLAEAVSKHDVLVVDVWAPWCGPCRVVGPILDDLAGELDGQVAIGKLNADDNRATVERFAIRGIPTMLVFKRGNLVEKIVGAAPKNVLKERFLHHAAH